MGEGTREGFQRVERNMDGASMLAYLDRGEPTEVIADASPAGLGAVLIAGVDGERRVACMPVRVFLILNVGTYKLKESTMRLGKI